MYVVEDLEAEQDDLDSSRGSVFKLLDTSTVNTTPKSVKHCGSGVTGGRSGLKRNRSTDDKTGKSSEPKTKKSPQGSTSCKRLRRNLSAEAQIGRSSADFDELVQSKDKTSLSAADTLQDKTTTETGQQSSSDNGDSQRIVRCNSSDIKLADLDNSHCPPIDTTDTSETVAPDDVSAETK